ncbi:Poly(A) RNA polymerase protein 2 [Pleurostoma richardsiae]|uniref:polynucleotide adenylyltransferase n=1 Tax=Pleurostoma richardsiae TaxID=41990 RepID=A0AA38RIH8_9PEZI|nr:Poly(A) RNA polymerase protein 2 [Pleurostoma richardsiae]
MSYDSRYPPPPGVYGPPAPETRYASPRDEPASRAPRQTSSTRGGSSLSHGDSYRPYSPSGSNEMHTSYSSRDQGGRYPDPYHSMPPAYRSLADYGRRDSVRAPQGDFTFRVDKPPGVGDSSYDSYRPGVTTGRDRHRNKDGAAQHRNRQDRNRRPRYQAGRIFHRFVPADRPILHASHSDAPTESFLDSSTGVVYKAIDELSDSDEADMDISDTSGVDDATHEPSAKRARVKLDQTLSGDIAPKWSNPDPYTALPPLDESAAHKKKDVVQLIRKARMHPASESKKASVPAEAEDFIRCDLNDSDDSDAGKVRGHMSLPEGEAAAATAPPTGAGVPEAPTWPRLTVSAQLQQQQHQPAQLLHSEMQNPLPGVSIGSLQPPSRNTASDPPDQTSRKRKPDADREVSSDLGSRKRTHDDEIKFSEYAKLRKPSKMPVHGFITQEWRKQDGEDSCPWMRDLAPLRSALQISIRLHMEIFDFYDLVKPRRFEERIRKDLVDRLNRLVRKRYSDVQILPFGSFMSGLYLPTGDMDLVFCSDRYRVGGAPQYNSKNTLWRLADYLRSRKVVFANKVDVIAKAKVPLVKYVDDETGLKVDISFENLTGVAAIKTFQAWKEQYPAMPVLVTVIKHFLLMRGLNEPVNGGIGGFSVICLVVSMLQMMPQVQSRDLLPEHHLGMMLMEFFDLYGNRFNYKTTAISMNPPRYIPKTQVTTFAYKNPDRLSIIDPNNPENDIAGGSSNTERIMRYFSEAFGMLRQRMTTLAERSSDPSGQNSILKKLHEKLYGPCEDD